MPPLAHLPGWPKNGSSRSCQASCEATERSGESTLEVLPQPQGELSALQVYSFIYLLSLVIPVLIIIVQHHLIWQLASLHTNILIVPTL